MEVIVIGGGAAGMSAASKIKRENPDYNVTVFEKSNFVSYAECGMPYYLAGYFDDFTRLLHYPITEFTEKRKIRVFINTKIDRIDAVNKRVFSGTVAYSYDKLVIATGASPKIPDVLKDTYFLRSMNEAINIKKKLENSHDVTLIGAGVLGTELFSLLSERYNVRLISKHEFILPYLDEDIGNVLKEIVLANNKNIEFNSVPVEVTKNNNKFTVKTEYGTHDADIVISSTGIIPDVSLAEEAGLKTVNGLISTDDYLHTSDYDIFAGGDTAAVKNIITGERQHFPLAQIANKMGRTIGININRDTRKFPGALGTTIINVFGWQVGYTGINERTAAKYNINAEKILVHGKSRSAYLNGSDVYIKIIINKNTEKIIGAQIIDKDNGAWRLNTLAAAITSGISVSDMFYADLGYEPEYGPVWDPIIIASSLGIDKLDVK
ncbi:FAD-dependent oxidoreductase [Acidiplasma sp.]|uniref:FAD-dependent oxidoreductase n=1 Tax=Acidiplasma sp. TaxID=1872114 RepID=UPI0025900858|nr:FAD-dependent oxidoreductase [Acidiplasma sp.]